MADFVGDAIGSRKFFTISFGRHQENDLADKLNWQITINLLVLFVFIISNARYFVNRLITCAVPIYFSSNQEEYANEICYIQNKYTVLDHERVLIKYDINKTSDFSSIGYIQDESGKGKSPNERPHLVSYYIWMPYILLLQAFIFLMSKHLWARLLYSNTSIDFNELNRAANRCKDVKENRFSMEDQQGIHAASLINPALFKNTNFIFLITNLKCFLYKSKITNSSGLSSLIFQDQKLSRIYLAIKVLNMLIIFFQIFIINVLLGNNFEYLGFKPLVEFFLNLRMRSIAYNSYLSKNLTESKLLVEPMASLANQSYESSYFPLRAMCTFKIRELAYINNYSIMCVLPINLFIQYVFVILMAWYLVLLGVNLYYFISWNLEMRKSTEIEYLKRKLLSALALKHEKIKTNFNEMNHSYCSNLYHLIVFMIYYNREFKGLKSKEICQDCHQIFELFFRNFLTSDFIFVLKTITTNSNDALGEQILIYFWELFKINFWKI